MLFKNLIQQESWRRVLIFHLVLQFKGIRRFCRVLTRTTAKAVMRLVFSLLGGRVFAAWAVRLQPRSRQHPWTLIKPISCALNQAPFWQWVVQTPELTPSIIRSEFWSSSIQTETNIILSNFSSKEETIPRIGFNFSDNCHLQNDDSATHAWAERVLFGHFNELSEQSLQCINGHSFSHPCYSATAHNRLIYLR